MDKTKFEFLKKCEGSVLDTLNLYVYSFASEVNSKLIFRSEKLSWIEMRLINNGSNKAIQIIISEGINAENEQSYSIRFNIQKMDGQGEKESSFSIIDYGLERNICVKLKDFYTERESFLKGKSSYLTVALEIMKTEEIQKILFTDYWIDVKPDLSPYR